jgi:4-hydroxy-tetrahydrodipicolinate synthase
MQQAAHGAHKSWAKAHMRGLETILMPSFTPDLKALDADGIRHDVRRSKAHGFFSVFLPGVGLTPHEHLEFARIAVDESKGEIAVSVSAGFETEMDGAEWMRRAADVGVTHALVHPPFHWRPADGDELYGWYRTVIDAAPIASTLWATDGQNFRHFARGNIPIGAMDRLADHERVVAVKLMTTLDEAVTFELCERVHQRMLIGCVNLKLFPMLSKFYGAQWSGAWTGEALQSPEKPFIADYIRQLNAGDYPAAIETYHQIMPAYGMLFGMMAPLLPKGVHPFTQLKFYQWFVGGNGGLMRPPHDPTEAAFKLTPEQREHVAVGFGTLGIEQAEGALESFLTGRAAYTNGVRAADLTPEATAIWQP